MLAFVAVVALPLAALAVRLCVRGGDADGTDETSNAIAASVLLRTFAWAGGIALLSCAIGWYAGRALRVAPTWLWGVVAGAALIPAYALFYCEWRVLRPGNFIAEWAMREGMTNALRAAVLASALIASLWPLCAVIVGAQEPERDSPEGTLLRLDSRRVRDRIAAAWRADGPSLFIAFLVIAACLVGESAAFDAAQSVTWASEIRAMDAAGATPAQVVGAGVWPLIATVLAACLVARCVQRWLVVQTSAADLWNAAPTRSRRRLSLALLLGLVIVLSFAPLAALALDEGMRGFARDFGSLHGRALATTLGGACIAGGIGGALAVAAATIAIEGRARWTACVLASSLLLLTMPATLLALAVAMVWRALPGCAWVYDSLLLVPLAHAGRYAAVAIAIGTWLGASVPRDWRDSLRVHGGSALSLLAMGAPRLLAAFIGGSLAVFALSTSETSIAARLQPPGAEWLAAILLNAIHYQDPASVLATLPLAALAAMISGGFIALVMRMGRASTASPGGRGLARVLLFAAALVAPGCTGDAASSANGTPPLPTERVFGRPGHTEGRFATPRALAVEPNTGCVFVIDKDARVQRFSREGTFELEWRMPKWDRGKPTGVSIAPDGRVFIADTHENRVAIYSRDGEWLGSFGSYGMEPGQFIFPCDIAFGRDGEIIVSEFGGNDRVQIFDSEGRFLRQFGRFGRGAGEFARPQSISLSPDGSEIFVADSCNHRIQVFSREGELKRTLGSAGQAVGELGYPYGVVALDDGTLLVAEFGNCRVQRIDARNGAPLGAWGGGGAEPGRLSAPWAVAATADRVFVLDSGNARVHSLPLASLR
jgi:DNA-binding beta-propeller fold protein YncE/ABC-type Fe3+ transport system permease subunit